MPETTKQLVKQEKKGIEAIAIGSKKEREEIMSVEGLDERGLMELEKKIKENGISCGTYLKARKGGYDLGSIIQMIDVARIITEEKGEKISYKTIMGFNDYFFGDGSIDTKSLLMCFDQLSSYSKGFLDSKMKQVIKIGKNLETKCFGRVINYLNGEEGIFGDTRVEDIERAVEEGR